jgi:K+-sensing histidine kinase KdpD
MPAAPGHDGSPARDDHLDRLVHDLRTPLTVVQGFAELLEKRGATLSAEQRDEYVMRIAEAARELRRLLDDERAGRPTPT